tara:strand:- start:951 stop:1376 length:426 start_codon:yes stop_codon:yes gene_type:complete
MATLKVTITEEISIDGVERGSSTNLDIASVTQVDNRIVTVTNTEADIVKFGSAIASGTFVASSVKYLRITNTATSGIVNLRILGTNEEYFVKLTAGNSFILNNTSMDANDSGSQSMTLANIEEIKAITSSGTVATEIIVVS